MCRTQSWIGWRAPVLALATIALADLAAGAAQMTSGLAYGTTGSIGTEGMLGIPAVRFHSVDHGKQGFGAMFSLGEFEVSAPSDHQTTTYAGTPFTLTYNDHSDPGAPPLVAQGNLFGTVSGLGRPNLLATLDGQSFLLDPSESGLQYRDLGTDPYPGPQPAAEREPGPDPGDGTVRSRAVPRAVVLGPFPRRRRVRRIAPPDRSLAPGLTARPPVRNPAGPPTPRLPAPPCRGAFFRTGPTFTAASGTLARTPPSLISAKIEYFRETPLQFINAGSQSQ